ncbi:hypothetical protein JCM39194_02230 [Desulfotomaculum varum]
MLEALHGLATLIILLGTFFLLLHSSTPLTQWPKKKLTGLTAQATGMIKYSLLFIARLPLALLMFLIIYGLLLSFYYWSQRVQADLTAILGLSIITAMMSLTMLALLMAPIIFVTQKLLFDSEIESRVFRIGVYSILVPFLYIFLVNDLPAPVSLLKGVMLSGLILNFYHIFKGIFICLQAPGAMFAYLDKRFVPVLMIISWLLVIIFNLFVMVFLVASTDPPAFVDSCGPVNQPLRLLYFTVITFTGVGYGDITPRGNMAEFIVMLVSITGFLYAALFVGGILAAFSGGKKE